ncbi:hypothetical protein N2152v2_010115 [Parachlorella kessleri]
MTLRPPLRRRGRTCIAAFTAGCLGLLVMLVLADPLGLVESWGARRDNLRVLGWQHDGTVKVLQQQLQLKEQRLKDLEQQLQLLQVQQSQLQQPKQLQQAQQQQLQQHAQQQHAGQLKEHAEQMQRQLQTQLHQKEQHLQQLERRLREGEGQRQQSQKLLEEVNREREKLWAQAQQDLSQEAAAFRGLLAAAGNSLEANWRQQLAAQRPRGVVMSAGARRLLVNAFVTLHVLRNHLKCDMPATIMYWGASKGDRVDLAMQKFFQEHIASVEFVDASQLPYPSYHRPLLGPQEFSWENGYKIKVFSIYAAPYREVLYLDSDSMPLLDPTFLFDLQQYRQHGNLYWPDSFAWEAWSFHPGELYKLLGLEVVNPWPTSDSQERQCEPGQFLLDRARWWRVLEWLLFLNTHDTIVYKLNYADKDTLRLAFALAGNSSSYQQACGLGKLQQHHLCKAVPSVPVNQYGSFILSNRTLKGLLYPHPSNGTFLFNHRTPLKYDADKGLPPTTHITAPLASDLAVPIIYDAKDAFGHRIKASRLLVEDLLVEDMPQGTRIWLPLKQLQLPAMA